MANTMICTTCTQQAAECMCLCQWPVQLLCQRDLAFHATKISTLYPHRLLNITSYSAIGNSRAEFDQFVQRLERVEKVKAALWSAVEQEKSRIQELDQVCMQMTDQVQGFRDSYRLQLEAKSNAASQQVNSALVEVQEALDNSSYKIQDQLARKCWEYISGQSASFEGNLNIESVPVLLVQFKEAADRLRNGLQRGNLEETNPEKIEIEKLKQANSRIMLELDVEKKRVSLLEVDLQSQNLQVQELEKNNRTLTKQTETQQSQLAKEESKVKKLESKLNTKEVREEKRKNGEKTCWESCSSFLKLVMCYCCARTGEWQLPSAFEILCCPCMMMWPCAACAQAFYLGEYNKRNINECGVCLLTTCLCCVGAAINKSRIREDKLNAGFLLDLCLFSMHCWNSCLVTPPKKKSESSE